MSDRRRATRLQSKLTLRFFIFALHSALATASIYGAFLRIFDPRPNPVMVDCINYSAVFVLYCHMQNTKRKTITEKQWKHAADAYELGTKNGRQIAAELGVSPSTVSRELKRRGCSKGSRVAEIIAPLEAKLNRNARARAFIRRADEEAAAERAAVNDGLIQEMMRSLIAAAKAGDITRAAPKIEEVGNTLGVKLTR
jgi:predicted transcriptional regulator